MRSLSDQLVILMKMKSAVLIGLLLSVSLLGVAQRIKTSLPLDFNVRNESVQILGQHQNTIFVHLFDRSDHQIAAFRDNLGLKWDKQMPFDTRDFSLEELLFEEGKFIAFYLERVRGGRLIKGQLYDSNLDSIAPKVKLDSIEGKFARTVPEPQFQLSQDRQQVVVYYIEEQFNDNDILHYTRLNRELDILEQGIAAIPTQESRHTFHELLVSNTGEVYIITAEYKDSGRDHASRYRILRSENNFISDSTLFVSPGQDRFLNNTVFKIDNANDHLVVTGFYADDFRQPAHAEGLFFLVIDLNSLEALSTSFQAFPTEFIAKIKGVRNPKRADKLYTFLIDEVILRQDGGALVVAESYYRTYRANAPMYDIYGMPMRSGTTITYHFDEIIVLSIHPDGEMHWKNILIKSQSSTGDYGRYGSYALMNTGKYLIFLFNDDLNTRSNVVQYTIDGSGKMDRDVLLNSRKYNVYLLPQFGKQISARSAVMPSIRKNKLRLLKVEY